MYKRQRVEREVIQNIEQTGSPGDAFAWCEVRAYNMLMEALAQHATYLSDRALYKPKNVSHAKWMNEFCELVEEAQ